MAKRRQQGKNSVWAREQIALVHKQNRTIVAGDRRTLSGVALVSMMKSSNLREYYNAPAFRLLHGSRLWSVLGQR
jgi:uncharacterized protein (DUF736 family)